MPEQDGDFDMGLNLIQRVNLGDALTRTAARLPDKEAIVDGNRRISYREFDAAVNRLSHALINRGYVRHDALAIMSGNSIEFLLAYFACAKIGAVAVPISLVWREREISYVLEHSGVRGIVVEAQLFADIENVLANCEGITDVYIAPGIATDGIRVDLETRFQSLAEFAALADSGPVEVKIEDRDPLSYMYTSGTTAAPKGVV